MNVLQVTGPMADHAYAALLAFLSGISSHFSLVVQDQLGCNSNMEAILAALQPYCSGCDQRREWPGTVLSDGTANVLTYRVCQDSIALLQAAASDLYSWRQPQRPEDLAFYRSSGDTLLETIAHERDARVFLTDTEAEMLRTLIANDLQGVDAGDHTIP